MPRLLTTSLMTLALLVPVAAPVALMADEHSVQVRTYHDREHNDDHQWNDREDRAYRMWAKENHRDYRDFNRIRPADQQAYWGWRHNHSDAQLNINIR